MKKIFLLLLLLPLNVFALEVDEKLTVRIIRTSESRKTVMINRGTEDGLVEGDHAKFIVTAGIVARGVCVQVSPSRSIWSIYRLVNADFLVNDSVMSIRITAPVKITRDESQALVQDDTPRTTRGSDPQALGIPLADGALEGADLRDEGTADLRALEQDAVTTLVDRNWELIGMLNISGLTANTRANDGGDAYTASQSFHHISFGAEYYPRREREWYSRFSLAAQVALMRENSQAYNGTSVTNNLTEFAVGTNWHPFAFPSRVGEFVPFAHVGLHMGTIRSSYQAINPLVGEHDGDANGTTSGFSIGGGVKFYTARGFGARAVIDYYTRAEKYREDIIGNTNVKRVAGPRLMMGMSYRF
jgi:hypothetical protein